MSLLFLFSLFIIIIIIIIIIKLNCLISRSIKLIALNNIGYK
ncbi:hypothetical protein ACMBCM_05110 [Spiroplasma sp. K1]